MDLYHCEQMTGHAEQHIHVTPLIIGVAFGSVNAPLNY
jgi:hypothetical protein